MKCAAPIAFVLGGLVGAGITWGILSSPAVLSDSNIETVDYFYPDGELMLRDTYRGAPNAELGTLIAQQWFTPDGDLLAESGRGQYGFFLDDHGAIKKMMYFQRTGEMLADGPCLVFDPPVMPTRIEYHEADQGKVREVVLVEGNSEE